MLLTRIGATLGRLTRRQGDLVIDPAQIVSWRGYAYRYVLPDGFDPGDALLDPCRSQLMLWEGGRRLGPARSAHEQIAARGCGRYSHWQGNLYFSTADGTDPRKNRRTYRISRRWPSVIDAWRRVQHLPANHRWLDPRAISEKAAYAVSSARCLRQQLAAAGIQVAGRRFLEIGPGSDFATTLLVGEDATEVWVADRFLPSWQEQYHPYFYRAVRDLWGGPSRRLDDLIRLGLPGANLHIYQEPVESLGSIATGSIELVLTNAVLEHVSDPAATARELARITARGGYGVHQVDFRDHRDFSRPLDHLLLEPAVFDEINTKAHNENGTRVRPWEWSELWKAAGFDVTNYEVVLRADPSYVADITGQLRHLSTSTNTKLPVDWLSEIGVRFTVVRR